MQRFVKSCPIFRGGDHDLWQTRLAIFRDHKKLHGHKIKPIFGDGQAPNMMPAEQVGYIRVKKYDHL